MDDRNGTVEKLKPELYRAIIDEAHATPLRVMAHIATLADAKDLLRAGVDGFGHSSAIATWTPSCVALLKARPNVFFVETMWGERNAIYAGPPRWLAEPIVRDTMSAAEIQQLRDGFLAAQRPRAAGGRGCPIVSCATWRRCTRLA